MRKSIGWMACLCTLALLCMAGAAAAQEQTETVFLDDVQPYNGPIGPGNPLYGLKIAFEDLDLAFTTNETEYITKQLKHSRLRLSEVRSELQQNNTEAAERAIALYLQSTNATRLRLQATNETGLLHAQEMVLKHQLVLQNLLEANPNSTGLQRAYNNSLALEQKFQEKTQMRFERIAEKNQATFMKAVMMELKQQEREEAKENRTAQVQETRTVPVKAGADTANTTGQEKAAAAKGAMGFANNGKPGNA
ncbi:MAG TPA: hypothetical protein ENN85_09990 [Methanoculleus sp.]|nr:hypothetical protein [Methanoculleus sp.]